MPYVCMNCGSFTVSIIEKRDVTITLNEFGDEEILEDNFLEKEDDTEMCAKCNSRNVKYFEVTPETAEKLLSIKDEKHRFIEFLLLALKDFDKNENIWIPDVEKEDLVKKLKELGVSDEKILVECL